MNYRPEIDGLRAIAVLPVILFHAGFGSFSGGFVGVDVFFVISGYLITSILIEDIENQRFSIVRFYERRARRILPALFFVILVCLPFAWSWMLAHQLKDFSASLFSVVTFVSNLFFLTQVNYFAVDAEMQPLLHTWSLAVEEQYYLFFPPLLYFIYRFGVKIAFWLVIVFSLCSFALAEWLGYLNPERNFFFTGSRLWEIGVGSIAAFIVRKQGVGNHQGLAILGLMAILLAIFTYDKSLPFPGVYTLLPVSGVLLLILFGGSRTYVAKVLSARVWVGLGLVSYSAYLWHQPIFAFARIRSLEPLSSALMAGLVLLSIIVAIFSWRFVEQPFRGKQPLLPQRRSLFNVTLFGLLLFGSLGVVGYAADGFVTRLPPKVAQLEGAKNMSTGSCVASEYGCIIGLTEQKPNIVMFGDSHANAYAVGFSSLLTKNQTSMRAVLGGCAPVLNYRKYLSSARDLLCGDQMDAAFHRAANDVAIDTVVLAAEWGYYVQGWRYESRLFTYQYDVSGNTDPDNNPMEFAKAFEATVALLSSAGKKVVVLEPLPEYSQRIPQAMAKIHWRNGQMENLQMLVEQYQMRNAEFFTLLDSPAYPNLKRVNVSHYFCDEKVCKPYNNDWLPLLSDGNHLNDDGLAIVSRPLLQTLGIIE